MQPELFPHSAFSIAPEGGRKVPRLWVRRIVVWRTPTDVIRDIPLKPGLNVIWSPDPGASDAAMGHGGGKTTFCRLLRYCLGEDSFAAEGQRHRIAAALPSGSVGAEIMLDGRPWVVIRSLGERRRDVVIENGLFEDAFREGSSPAGIRLLRTAIGTAIVGNASRLMPAEVGEPGAWEVALAWATRDQECRFGHQLDWRDPNTESHSPVRRLSRDGRLHAVRAFIGALTEDEISAQLQRDRESDELSQRRLQIDRLDWQIKRLRAALTVALGDPNSLPLGTPFDAATFKTAAAKHLAVALGLPIGVTLADLTRSRQDRDAAKNELRRVEDELRDINTRIQEREKGLAWMRSELPEAHARLTKERNPVCPICEVPISKALAEGCGISALTCDIEALQNRIAKRREAIRQEEGQISAFRWRQPGLKDSIAQAKRRLEPLERTVLALERALGEQSNSVRMAQRLVDDAERYEELINEKAVSVSAAKAAEARLQATVDILFAHRASVVESVNHLSCLFDAVLRELVSGEIRGEAKLDGNGLTLRVELGGERSTAAIESLKVVAFDLATLAMSIEGQTFLPSFLVHDSPREADLGVSIYNRLFDFARRLEKFGPAPLFQYIITTTTEPPDGFLSEPWLRLTMRGAPAAERLLGVDL